MMLQILVFIAWSVGGFWMFRCLGRTPKQCLQCVIGRYIGLLVVLLLIIAFFPK